MQNGIRVISRRLKDRRGIALALYLDFGSRHEKADQNGYTHFVEHLNFQGTRKRSVTQIALALDDVGGNIDAYTARDHTAYTAFVLRENLERTFDVSGRHVF